MLPCVTPLGRIDFLRDVVVNKNREIKGRYRYYTFLSLQVMPVLDLARDEIRRLQLIPDYYDLKWIPQDDHCDASYALISAIDSYADDCVHVFFGPVCEYALGKFIK